MPEDKKKGTITIVLEGEDLDWFDSVRAKENRTRGNMAKTYFVQFFKKCLKELEDRDPF
jgi:hypothetical protein